TRDCTWWSTVGDMKEVIAAAIEFERFGAEYYMRFHDLVNDKEAKSLMKSLASDESEHAAILSRELQVLGGSHKKSSKEEVEKGLAEIFPNDTREGDLGIKDAVSAIKLGMKTEERSIEFYSKNASIAAVGLKDIFLKLESMEREHLRILQENLEQLENSGAWYGYVPILEG
ncbi:MAG: ferritin family protein, partial [Thermoplasmata archaeon]|nr:ferritin family protein [Thermoplasmata archaeon]